MEASCERATQTPARPIVFFRIRAIRVIRGHSVSVLLVQFLARPFLTAEGADYTDKKLKIMKCHNYIVRYTHAS